MCINAVFVERDFLKAHTTAISVHIKTKMDIHVVEGMDIM
jgi:hypothetical protein